jgi:hypothetical protein
MKPSIFTACAILLTAGLCLAQTASSQPAAPAASAAAQPAAAASQPSLAAPAGGKVTVVSVTGQAQKCDSTAEPKKWEAIQAGDVLSDLTLIRTGFNSGVVLNLGQRGEVRIGSATKIGITEFRKEGPLAKTTLGLKYGTFQADVDSKKGPADFRVSTPTATLSVRGSEPEVSYGSDVGTQGFSHEGILQFIGAGFSQSFHPGEGGNDHHVPPFLLILMQFWDHQGDPFGLTGPEIQNLILNGQGQGGFSGGGPTTTFQNIQLQPPARGPTSQPSNPFFPGF